MGIKLNYTRNELPDVYFYRDTRRSKGERLGRKAIFLRWRYIFLTKILIISTKAQSSSITFSTVNSPPPQCLELLRSV